MCLSYFIEYNTLNTMLDLKQNKNKILISAKFDMYVQFKCIGSASINMGKYQKDINSMKCECTRHMCTK